MWLRTRFDLSFEIIEPTPFVLMLRPRNSPWQWTARETYRLIPSVPVTEFIDPYGNLCQRLIAPPGPFAVHTSAEVMTADSVERGPGEPYVEVQHLPDTVLTYLLPSRYCESDRFFEMASAITADAAPGYDQVAAIEEWLRGRIDYVPGSSNVPESAVEVNRRQSGVCRDLSHLGIALCRSVSIPARMVVGYLAGLEPMDMHAWFEAYVGGRWFTFDATQRELRGGYVAIGHGRDAADVAVYNQFGLPVYPLNHEVRVERIAEPT